MTYLIIFNDFEPLFGRTTITSKNGFTVIQDVAHNEDGIKESLIKLEGTKFDQVVISIARRKDKDKILKLFKDTKVFLYQPDQSFWTAEELNLPSISNVKEFYEKLDKPTLFIGSFRLIGDINE